MPFGDSSKLALALALLCKQDFELKAPVWPGEILPLFEILAVLTESGQTIRAVHEANRAKLEVVRVEIEWIELNSGLKKVGALKLDLETEKLFFELLTTKLTFNEL